MTCLRSNYLYQNIPYNVINMFFKFDEISLHIKGEIENLNFKAGAWIVILS